MNSCSKESHKFGSVWSCLIKFVIDIHWSRQGDSLLKVREQRSWSINVNIRVPCFKHFHSSTDAITSDVHQCITTYQSLRPVFRCVCAPGCWRQCCTGSQAGPVVGLEDLSQDSSPKWINTARKMENHVIFSSKSMNIWAVLGLAIQGAIRGGLLLTSLFTTLKSFIQRLIQMAANSTNVPCFHFQDIPKCTNNYASLCIHKIDRLYGTKSKQKPDGTVIK